MISVFPANNGGPSPSPGSFLDGGPGRDRYNFTSINSYSNGIHVINKTGVPDANDFPGLTKLIVVKNGSSGRPFSFVGSRGPETTTSFTASASASISRGHKFGYPFGYRFNGADQPSTGGEFTAVGSGAGATPGGSGGYFHSTGVSGSGGGSGYHDGSVNVVSTRLGGNSNQAGYIIIQLRE